MYLQSWKENPIKEVLAGIVVSFALIPEVIGFTIIEGIDPMIGLVSSFFIAIIVSFLGGRPGMVSAAAGSMALVMVHLVKNYGLEYMFAATILTGLIQLLLGLFQAQKLMSWIPKPVMLGFVDALAILIFMAQFEHFQHASIFMYALVIGGILLMVFAPKIISFIPAGLIVIGVLTAVAVFGQLPVSTIGDLGAITPRFSAFHIPMIPWNFDTLKIIFPTSLALAFVGMLESLLTAEIVDERTNTESPKRQELLAQGSANLISGIFAGVAGCAMIGQTIINLDSKGRGRLSTVVAGAFMMILIFALRPLLLLVPIAALVAIMTVVAFNTFDWATIRYVKEAPKKDVLIFLVTTLSIVATGNLAIGVLVGVLISAVLFVRGISILKVKKDNSIIKISGELFFATTTKMKSKLSALELTEEQLTLDLSELRIWDSTGAEEIIKYKEKLRETKQIAVISPNLPSNDLIQSAKLYT
ncbi:SulP family inorganic anion transporter [Enterococcus sp. 669A]|uniref:SulP family inorganic anion transporter n=1 Tax=Candidatus Enterococcus moelleringii TaxID=2815325 RepID=A0ABS3L7L2_9ENTE|nr:SulP family inorganic anion transporter [Enterococcus sp. 669A]MBO1305620.1 SulP family inorganic anion transporter [Enterococcus sp. 669A]